MLKPWYKSISIVGAITAAVGYASDPRTLDLLGSLPIPDGTKSKVAGALTVVGLIGSVFGIRRAIPDASIMQTASGQVSVLDPSGVLTKDLTAPRNQWGETPAQEATRLAVMAAKGEELKKSLEAQGR